MRARRDSRTGRRNSFIRSKKKSMKNTVEGDDISPPEKSKINRGYKFHLKRDDILSRYVEVLKARYSEERVEEYSIDWKVTSNDRGDKNLQFQIKVREKKRKPISNIEVTTKPTDLQTLYVITVYQSSLAVLVQGKLKDQWVNKEYPLLKAVYMYMKEEVTKTASECYDHVLKTIEEASFQALVDAVADKGGMESKEEDDTGYENDTRYENDRSTYSDLGGFQPPSVEGIKRSIDAIGATEFEMRTPSGSVNSRRKEKGMSKEEMVNLRVIEEAVSEMNQELTFWINTYKKDKGKLEKQLKNVIEQVIGLLIIGNRELKNKVDGLEETVVKQKDEITKLKLHNNEKKKEESEFKTIVKYLTGEMFELRKRMDKMNDIVKPVNQVNNEPLSKLRNESEKPASNNGGSKKGTSNVVSRDHPLVHCLDKMVDEINSWDQDDRIKTTDSDLSDVDSLKQSKNATYTRSRNETKPTKNNEGVDEDEDRGNESDHSSDRDDQYLGLPEKLSPLKTSEGSLTDDENTNKNTKNGRSSITKDAPLSSVGKYENIRRSSSGRKGSYEQQNHLINKVTSKRKDSPPTKLSKHDPALAEDGHYHNVNDTGGGKVTRRAWEDIGPVPPALVLTSQHGVTERSLYRQGSCEDQPLEENDTAKILVLMGSNRKHGPLHRLFPQKTITVIPCVSMTKAKTILNSYRMDAIATNDLHPADIDDVEVTYPETIAEELSNIAKEFIESFHCKTYVSTLTRETNNLEELVVTANSLLQQTLGYKETDNIMLIKPEKLTDENVRFYERHKHENRTSNRLTTNENYVSGVEVLYMNLHSPQLDKILQTYLKDDDVNDCDVIADDVGDVDDVTNARNGLAHNNQNMICQSGVETTV